VVTQVLKDNVPAILSEDMTRKFERESEAVAVGKMKREDVIEEAKKVLTQELEDFKGKEDAIGKTLLDGLVESRAEERSMGPCPNCGEELRMIVSKKSGKRFIGCSGYPKCSTSFPLPQKGYLTKLKDLCKECGMPMIQLRRKGARAYQMCINHKCKTKADWGTKTKRGKKPVLDEKTSVSDSTMPKNPTVGSNTDILFEGRSDAAVPTGFQTDEKNGKDVSKASSTAPTVRKRTKKTIILRKSPRKSKISAKARS